MTAGRQDVPSLYALKAVCALFVVLIHFPCTLPIITQPLTIMAVPCFFMITGYFLNRGTGREQSGKALRWSGKAFVATIVVNLAYIVVEALFESRMYKWEGIAYTLFVGDNVACHLWYLSALWQALIILALIVRARCGLVYFLPLLLLNGMVKEYCLLLFHVKPAYILYSPAVFCALPYTAIGYLLRGVEDCIAKSKGIICIVSCMVALAASYAEGLICTQLNGGAFVRPVIVEPALAVAVFLLCLHFKRFGGKILAYIGKYHSANIYYLHMAVGHFVCFFSRNVLRIGCYKFVVIYVLSLALSCLYAFISKRAQRAWKGCKP